MRPSRFHVPLPDEAQPLRPCLPFPALGPSTGREGGEDMFITFVAVTVDRIPCDPKTEEES